MSHARTSSAERRGAAWDLWLVRFLSRFALQLPPKLVTATFSSLSVGASLLALAGLRAFGDAAAANVRGLPGFFAAGAGGLTNATHFVFWCAVPLLANALASLAQLFGLVVTEDSTVAQERAVWQGLSLSAGDIVLTHEVLPRLPLLLVVWTPVAALLGLSELARPEVLLAGELLAFAAALELGRVGVAAQRLWRPVRPVSASSAAILVRLGGAAMVGLLAGGAVRVLAPRWIGIGADPAVARLSGWLASNPFPVLGGCLALAGAGVGLLIAAIGRDRGFARVAGSAPAAGVSGRLTNLGFPVVGRTWVARVWAAPELRWAVAGLAAAAASGVDRGRLPSEVIAVALVAALMGGCVGRLAPAGLSAGLMRLRHHFELGASPARMTWLLVLAAYLATGPLLVVMTVLLVQLGGVSVSATIGIVLLTPLATLVADAIVAQAGTTTLTEPRLLVLALVQSLLVMGGSVLFTVEPAAGWTLSLILIGVQAWLPSRRLRIWLVRSRP